MKDGFHPRAACGCSRIEGWNDGVVFGDELAESE